MSISDAAAPADGKRGYRLGKRAGKREETRRRIVEAAVHLHGSIGPARTSVSQIADRAGVQRHTFYAHFPDERSLFLACSGFAMESDPLPDPEHWLALPPGRERLRHGLAEIHGWFGRNAELAASVLRDAEHHATTREMVELRMKPVFDRAADVLEEGLRDRARALLSVAMEFACWRALAHSSLPGSTADLMTEAIMGVAAEGQAGSA